MIRVTLEGATWEEVEGQAMELVRHLNASPAPPPITRTYSEDQHLAAVADPRPRPLQSLPLDKPPMVPPPSAPGGVCPEHLTELRFKPAGTNRQGTPYSAGWRCPAQGCRTFVAAA
jgi:hypothetical protein